MTSTFTYTVNFDLNKGNVLDCFKWYIINNFDLGDSTRELESTTDPTGTICTSVTFFTRVPVPDNRVAELDALVANYVEPIYYFPGLNHIETYPISSTKYNGTDSFPLYTWIMPYKSLYLLSDKGSGPSVINEIKLLFEIHTDDISIFTNYNEPVTTFTVELFCITTYASIATTTVDISNIIDDWKININNGITGSVTSYKTMEFTNMWNKNPDHDCIRTLNISGLNPFINLSVSTLQYICYNPPIFM